MQGPFDFSEALQPLDDIHQQALDSRPDLRAALEAIQQAQTNHKLAIANGAVDPTFSGWYTWNNAPNDNPNANQTLGLSVSIPLRIFDRNQGEKQRTAIDINRSGTRKEELLMPREELNRVWILRKVLNPLSPVESMELLIDKLSKTRNNAEFLAAMSG